MARHLSLVQPSEEAPLTAATPESAFRQYAPYVAAVARRLLGNDQELEDVVQDVFVRALTSIETMKNPAAIRAWLASLTVRVVALRFRRLKFRRFIGLEVVGNEESIRGHSASPEQLALLRRVYEVLEAGPVRERLAWSLRYVEGQRLEEVAQSCGCSVATAKRRIAAAQRRIDKELSA